MKMYNVTYNLVKILKKPFHETKTVTAKSEIIEASSFADATKQIRDTHGYDAKNIKVEEISKWIDKSA